ncbi:hypothetical protein ACLESO_20640 [Pyxidicoccus sp. 3LG]
MPAVLLSASLWLLSGCSDSDDAPEDPPLPGFDDSTRRPLFPPGAPWNQDISAAPVDTQSSAVIAYLQGRGWGTGRMQMDFSIEVLVADERTPFRDFQPTDDFYEVECDAVPVPVPPGGALEGESGYSCTTDGDCHLIVIHRPTRKLYEQWRVDIEGNSYRGGCLAVWDLSRVYPPEGRGDQCTSADAAGLPIAPLLFDADEVAAGEIKHAIRFILPNDRIRHATYVRPATHATRAASGGTNAPPYGARLRLRANYPVDSLPTQGARVVARALQRYGMFLADGGNITLTGQSDRLTTAKWDGLLGPRDLQAIQPSDFEWVEAGPRLTWDGDCVRTP